MAARRPFWKWHRWKSIGFCLRPPSTCIWNHVVYRPTDRRTDGQTDGRTRWIQYTPPLTSLGGGIIISGRGQDTSAWHISDLSFHMLSLECPEIPISSFGNWASTSQNWIISGGGQDTSACYIWGHSSCGVTIMRRLSRVWVRGGWPAHAQCAYVEPRDIQPRGALSCSDCQGRQAWFCRSSDL